MQPNTTIATNTDKLLQFITNKFMDGQLDNDSLVQLIELSGSFLNLATIPNYAKANKLTYNGVKKCRTIKQILGVKWVIDNE
jgi:hypothetical protein